MAHRHSRPATSNEHAPELFRLLVESAVDYAIFTTDIDRRVTSWNTGAERLMGWSEAEILGKTADIVFTPEDRERGMPETETAQAIANGRAEDQRWHMRKDGTRFWGDGVMQPLKHATEHVRGFVKIFRDRTSELEAQEARDEADRRKDEFLAILAHELRNPVAAISNASQLSLRTDANAETIAWSKDVIARQVLNLSHIIDDLLDISRINRGQIRLRKEPVHVGTIVTRAVDVVSPLMLEKNHEVSVTVGMGPMQVNGDPTRLEQVIANLLVNAAKYTDPGGRIAVTASPEDDAVVIKIKDNGIGIAPEMLAEVFRLFAQADKSLDRTRGGLGIGLSVVKKLVEMHEGSVWASSEGLGRGAEFSVRFPRFKGQSLPVMSEQPMRIRGGEPAKRILVVDDNIDSAVGLARLLRLAGHEVVIAHDGRSAIDVASAMSPDVVLLDIGLPGRSGYEVASELQARQLGRDCIVIAVSGYSQEEDRARSRAAGFNHHLAKPVDFEELMALIAMPTQ